MGKPAQLNQKLYSKAACKSSQILSQWKPWSNKNIVKQMPPGWLIIGILSFFPQREALYLPCKMLFDSTARMFWGGKLESLQWFVCEGFLTYAFILFLKQFLKGTSLNLYCHKRLLIPWLSLLQISCKQLLHCLCHFMDVVPV